MKLRDELVASMPETTCCRRALLAGMTAGLPVGGGVLTTPSEAVAILASELAAELVIPTWIDEARHGFAVQVGLGGEGPAKRRCCRRAWLRGTFIVGGGLTDPQKAYNLEWAAPKPLLGLIASELTREELHPRLYERTPGHWILYSKSSEEIATILALIEATQTYLLFEDLRSERDLRNHVHRQVNYEVANTQKAADAGSRQADEIGRMRALGLLDALPESLRQAALLREQHPLESLLELCALADPPVSKSGMAHRLKKLHAILAVHDAETGPSGQP
jgi:DNA-binding protein WhiA